jgi:hypothetical protein
MNENDGAESSRLSRYLEQGLTILFRLRFGSVTNCILLFFGRAAAPNPCIIETTIIRNFRTTPINGSLGMREDDLGMAVDDQIRSVGEVLLLSRLPGSKPTRSKMEAKSFGHLMARARPLGRARDQGGRVSLFLGQAHRVIARLRALDMSLQHVVTDQSRQDGTVPVIVRVIQVHLATGVDDAAIMQHVPRPISIL